MPTKRKIDAKLLAKGLAALRGSLTFNRMIGAVTMKTTRKQILNAMMGVLELNRDIAVAFSRDLKSRVRVTRKRYFKRVKVKGKRGYKRVRIKDNRAAVDLTVTIDRPNYQEREFLRQCKRAKCKPKALWFPSHYA